MGFLGGFRTRCFGALARSGVSAALLAALGLTTGSLASCTGTVGRDAETRQGGEGGGGKGGNTSSGGEGGDGSARVVLSDLSTASLAAMCTKPAWAPARLWRLSRDQLRNTLKDALAVDLSDGHAAAFNDGQGILFGNDAASLRIRKADADSWTLAARDVAALALPAIKASSVCSNLDLACAGRMVDHVGPRLFRRSLSSEEKSRYQKLYELTLAAPGGTGERAAQAVVNAMLMSPYFLYRTELGRPVSGKAGVAKLTPEETATALSFTLWQSNPDAELLEAAAEGKLDTAEDLARQAERMAGDPRFVRFLAGLLADLTRASRMATREGVDDVPQASAVMKSLAQEFEAYAKTLAEEGLSFADVLRKTSIALTTETAKFRNLAGAAASSEVELPSNVSGLLSLGAVNFANAGTDHPSPVKRGVMVRENFLCSPVPPPPPDVKQERVPRGDEVITNRHVYEKTMAPATCNGCHRLFNPIGYAFESFDEQGRYRTIDNGAPIDQAGEIVDTRDADGAFADLAGLAQRLSDSQQAKECFVLNAFRFTSGRIESPGDLCHASDIHAAWTKAEGDLKRLAVLLVTSPSFVMRSTSL